MSEERSWADDTVELDSGARRAPREPDAVPTARGRRPGGLGAAAAIGVAGVLLIVFVLLGGGDESRERPKTVKVERERIPSHAKTTTPEPPSLHRPLQRRAGSLAIGLSRRAPKPAKPQPAPAPAPVEPEAAAPTYEATPEPVAEPVPAPEASPAPAPETPAAVEFGM